MNTQQPNNQEKSTTFDKHQLKHQLNKFLEYSDERSKGFPVEESTIHNFYELFMAQTYEKLKRINPAVIRVFTIRAEYLLDLIKKASEAKYVKITLVQVPADLESDNEELLSHRNNLYYFFTLSNGHGNPNLTSTYFDLNTFNDTMLAIPDDIARKCIDEFNDIKKETSLKQGLFEITKPKLNTEHIYMNMDQLCNDYLPKMKKHQMKHIAFVFCQIDNEDEAALANERTRVIVEPNPNGFGCLMKGIDINNKMIVGAPVYDFNELCPNMCPPSK